MIYLIVTFASAFIYAIFLLTIRETMRRFYKKVNIIGEDESERQRWQRSHETAE